MRLRLYLPVLTMLCLGPVTARAQFGGGAIFEPEISVVNSGAVLDAQATVSADRKYVTMTMRPSVSQLLALRTFQFQGFGGVGGGTLPSGTVGGVNPVIVGAVDVIPLRLNAPMRLGAGNGGAILLRRGITPLVIEN
ncbi:MAG: hypothetical protein JWN40_1064 [Phycisphaerales bacterium]|nr:hypothetical protein [Phycisphaerales bacterium]